jgi:adenine-specific DNA-methyltransferase
MSAVGGCGETVQAPITKKSVNRLSYIGSKFQLLDWLIYNIQTVTGWSALQDKTIGDIMAGTGIVSHKLRKLGAATISNDTEPYSAIITEALALSTYNAKVITHIDTLNKELTEGKAASTIGFITENYSPAGADGRMFFTTENAKRIDYIRNRIVGLDLEHQDRIFLIASLLISADAVSNVPSVYGCYLKNFKKKALNNLTLKPIHTHMTLPKETSQVYCLDILTTAADLPRTDAVYIDPPYNERQYSKNYFPLNMIAKTPAETDAEPPLTGKTGIPQGCYISPFCRKGEVENAFKKLIGDLKTEWVFLSYNSESLIEKEKMQTLLEAYGTVQVVERDYKRFKSFDYNEGNHVVEYLFCLHRRG